MKTMRDLINCVNQLNEGWWPSRAKPEAKPAPTPQPRFSHHSELGRHPVQDKKTGTWYWEDSYGNRAGALTRSDLEKQGIVAPRAEPAAKAPDPHTSMVVDQLQKLAYQLRINPKNSSAREQVAHYVWGLKKTAPKYGAEQWLPHLAAIEKNTGDVAAINKFVTDYRAAHK